MTNDITVCIPSIPPRVALLSRALASVHAQTLPASDVSIAYDIRKQGAAPTRQRALDAARTPWVAFLDDDDHFMPQHLEACLRHAEETGADYVYSWFKVQSGDRIFEHDPVFPPSHFLNPFNPDDPIETTITVLVKTDLAKSVGFINHPDHNPVWPGEDRRFTMECLAKGAKISHLVEHTWYWDHSSGNTSGLPTRW